MPELPEVETIRLGLEEHLTGKNILSVEIRYPKIFEGNVKEIIGAKVTSINRFGKVLSINLDNNKSLVVHVKMTGQLIYIDSKTKKRAKVSIGDLPGKFTHVIFNLSSDARLFYNDIRKFGWIRVLPTKEVSELKSYKQMGPEPLKDLTLTKFKEILSKYKTKIKILLMDQTKIGGVGNIYANDALFLAKIDPRRESNSLSQQEVEKLFAGLEEVLTRGLHFGGSSENTYVNALGEKGSYQEHTLVYGKTGRQCPNCGGKVIRITLGGRGTFICESCQN